MFFIQTHLYLFLNWNDNAWIIDPGDIDKIVEILPKKCSVKGVFITHYHFDHIYGLNSLTYLFPGLVVFATEIIATGLYSDKMNLSYYHNQSFVYQGKNLFFLVIMKLLIWIMEIKLLQSILPGTMKVACLSC